MTSKIRYAVPGFVALAVVAAVLVAASRASHVSPQARATPEFQRVGRKVIIEVASDPRSFVPATGLSVAVTAGPDAKVDLDRDRATPRGFAGSCSSDSGGRCRVAYTGRRSGVDTVRVWVDTNGDRIPSAGEPAGTAAVHWFKRTIGGNVTLGSSRVVTFGSPLVVTGSVHAGGVCSSRRTIRLERLRRSASVWEQVGSAESDARGAFHVRLRPEEGAVYRTIVEPHVRSGVGCNRLTSKTRKTVVRPRVSARAMSSSLEAGDCTNIAVTVVPNKAGTEVRVQRRTASGWMRVGAGTLDPLSRTEINVCFPWSSIGTVAFRAVWSRQDASNAAGTSPAATTTVGKAWWMKKIDHLADGHTIGIAIRAEGRFLYEHADTAPYTPASNEKLLLSMALLDRFGPDFRLPTALAVPSLQNGVVGGNLWILGSGNPSVRGPTIAALARTVVSAGVRRIDGSVMGSTGYFAHDWWAPGWKSFFPAEDIALPTALTYRGNQVHGIHVRDPERRAAEALTSRLRGLGVAIRGPAGSGLPPGHLRELVSVQSRPLSSLVREMDHDSDNFIAEVLGKRLGADLYGAPGTIARGAAAIASWSRSHGVADRAYDSSGLSYGNRIAPAGITRLLQVANHETWGPLLRYSLAAPGERGTLKHRLKGVRVRAKTGTLEFVSALSGWVWLRRLGTWGEFSILSRGMYTDTAKSIENRIVRLTARYGH